MTYANRLSSARVLGYVPISIEDVILLDIVSDLSEICHNKILRSNFVDAKGRRTSKRQQKNC